MNCPACGAENQTCGHGETDERRIVTMANEPRRIRVPYQRTRRGKTGYSGDVEMYDPQAPHVTIVQDDYAEPVEDEEPVEEEKPKRKRPSRSKQRKPSEDK